VQITKASPANGELGGVAVPSFIKSPKDFCASLIYIGFGVTALYVGWDYRMGTAGRMGPGYFPKVLAWMLIALGVVALLRSFVAKGESITTIKWKPLVLILLACAAFGYLLAPFGLIVALVALCVISAAASREFQFDLKATLGMLALSVLCALVFVKGLGVPMPIVGYVLEPFLGPLMPWLR
jgi:Tripartite tricarboxylate transporter TctB family